MAFKLPRIEATIMMVDNVTATMRGVRASIAACSAPVDQLSKKVGGLKVALSTMSKTAGFPELRGAVTKTHKDFSKIGDGATKSFQRLGGVLLGTGGVIGMMGALVNSAASGQHSLNMTAKRAGTTATELRNLRYAGQMVGIETDTTDAAMMKFAKNLGDARAGTGNALAPLKAMGVHLRDNKGQLRDQQSVLLDVAAAMGKLPNQQDRLRVATALFGRGNTAFVNVLGQGKEALTAQFDEIMRLRGPVKQATLDQATAFQASKIKMGMAMSGLKSAFATPLIAAFTESTTSLMKMVEVNRPLIAQFGKMAASALPEVLRACASAFQAIVTDAVPVVKVIWKIMSVLGPAKVLFGSVALFVAGPFVASIISAIPGLIALAGALGITGASLMSVLWPVAAVLAAIVALAGGVYLLYKYWDNISKFMDTGVGKAFTGLLLVIAPFIAVPLLIIKHWSSIKTFFSNLWGSITDGFRKMTADLSLKNIPVVGGMLQAGINLVSGPSAAPAAAPAAGATQSAANAQAGQSMMSRLAVDFTNLPMGTRVGQPVGNAPVDISAGYYLGGVF